MEFENEIAHRILNICFDIHKQYGPGLFERVHENILCYELYELKNHNLEFVTQFPIDVIHDGVNMDLGFRADGIVEDVVLLELKSVSKLEDVHS